MLNDDELARLAAVTLPALLDAQRLCAGQLKLT
jgi:hypothetical protein